MFKVGFIGKGNVALSFAVLFEQKGIDVAGFHTRLKPDSEMIKECDIIFIATPDDQIELAAKTLPQTAKVYCHFSGALSPSALSPLKGAVIASLHPAMTFTGVTPLTGVPCMFEGEGKGLEDFLLFLRGLGLSIFEIDREKKPLYHAAMCNVSNHISTLVYMTTEMLKEFGVNEKDALSIISPLASAALNNTLAMGAEKALTGPISRGDIGTLTLQMPFADDTYKALAAKTAELALAAGRIDESTVNRIREILGLEKPI